MCNSCFGGNNCWWIIILVLLFCCCGNGNNGCGKELEQVGIEAEGYDRLNNDVVNSGSKSNRKKTKSKIFEDLSKKRLAYTNRGKTDNNGALTHFNVCRANNLQQLE